MSRKNGNSCSGKDSIITPGGPRTKKQVHRVGPEEMVRVDKGTNALVVARKEVSSKTEGRGANMSGNVILTPGGFRHTSQVHRVEPENVLEVSESNLEGMALPAEALEALALTVRTAETELGSGWIAYAEWTSEVDEPISSFRATWQVPNAPATQSDQTIYLFPGMQNLAEKPDILQPVLQWGSFGFDDGPCWSVSSWYVFHNDQAFHTQPVRVSEGDTLIGLIKHTGTSVTEDHRNVFSYSCEFEGILQTKLLVSKVEELKYCCQVMEAYGIKNCSDYPAADRTIFSAIEIEIDGATPTPKWVPKTDVTDCGQYAEVVNNPVTNEEEVYIYYRS
jgi:hypothetical protein